MFSTNRKSPLLRNENLTPPIGYYRTEEAYLPTILSTKGLITENFITIIVKGNYYVCAKYKY